MTVFSKAQVRFQLLGVLLLVICVLFVALSVGFYRKSFVGWVPVRLQTDHVGNQLREGADVKIRGVLVGEVRSVRSNGEHAELALGMFPDEIDRVPGNVTARLLPKTLFGERYVSLQLPERGGGRLAAGDVIGQDRSSTAVEVEEALSNLLPLLKTLQPHKVSATLGAISQALDGRGEQLGDTAVRLDEYLRRINPSLPDLGADLEALGPVADAYAKAGPDLLEAMSNLTTTSRTVADKQAELPILYQATGSAAVDLREFLEVNRDNLIRLVGTSEPTLQVLAKYAPEYPCVLEQMADQIEPGNRTMGKGKELPHMGRLTIEFTQSRGKYVPGLDDPEYADKRGPRCYQKASPDNLFPQYPPGGPIKDGSSKPPAVPKDWGALAFSGATTAPAGAEGSGGGVPLVADSPEEHRLVNALSAPSQEVPPRDVPQWGPLLTAPLYRGAEVALR